MDSLEGLQLLIELERVTNATVEEADMKRFTTIQSIVDLLERAAAKSGRTELAGESACPT